jgi:hypothetical protein
VTNLTSNLLSITGLSAALSAVPGLPSVGTLISGITPNLASVQTAMDSLGKASQFAATASSTLSKGLDKLSTLTVDNVTGQLKESAVALANKVEGSAKALVAQGEAQVKALVSQGEAQAKALIANAEAQAKALFTQADSLVADVKKAAAFANTVDRASVDVATTKIFGSAKIPTPNFGAPNSASIAAALDISKAQAELKNLQAQGGALLSQAQGLANQAQNLAGQAQGAANNLLATSKTAVNQLG